MISGEDIVILSTIDWGFLWQGHQEIASRLAAAGNRVLFVENTGVRAPGLRDANRVAARLRNWGAAWRSVGLRRDPSGVYVYSPVVLPPFGSSGRRALNRMLFLRMIGRAVKSLGMSDPLIWNYLPTDTAVDLIRMLHRSNVVVYYCVDSFAALSSKPVRLRHSEREVVRSSDVVFATHSELGNQCARWNDNVHIFPFGVDLDAFPRDAMGTRSVGHPPVIGYVGGVHRHVDISLLTHAAQARPNWNWVFVGALQTPVGELSLLPNVQMLGQRPHTELADHIRGFDVCIVPYVDSSYTATVVPTKINEYLALGKSVVSTSIPAVREFNDAHDVLFVCDTRLPDFLEKLEAALAEQPVDERKLHHRREVAELGDWATRLDQMSALIMKEKDARRGRP